MAKGSFSAAGGGGGGGVRAVRFIRSDQLSSVRASRNSTVTSVRSIRGGSVRTGPTGRVQLTLNTGVGRVSLSRQQAASINRTLRRGGAAGLSVTSARGQRRQIVFTARNQGERSRFNRINQAVQRQTIATGRRALATGGRARSVTIFGPRG